MSTSPANPETATPQPANPEPSTPDAPTAVPAGPDDGPGQAARPFGRSKDEITVVHVPGVPPVPAFLSADAARPPVSGAQPAATPTLEDEVRKLQAALNTAAGNPPIKRLGRRDGLPPGVVRGSAAPGRLTALLSRPGIAVAGMATAAVVGAWVFVILPQMDDWEFAEPPSAATRQPSAPPAAAAPYWSKTGVTAASETIRQFQPLEAPPVQSQSIQSPQVSPPPMAPPESRPVETPMDVAALPVTDDSPAATAPSAIPEPSAMTARGPAPPAAIAPEPERPERAVTMAPVPELAAREPAPPAAPDTLALAAPVQPGPPTQTAPARPEAPMAAAREPDPPARPEEPANSLAADQMPPTAGMTVAPHDPDVRLPDSNAWYPAGAAQQKLSVDRLRTARNEIFTRKGFKDDALRVHSGAAEAEAETRDAVADPHSQYLTRAQLQRLSPVELVLVRSEILARRGRYFKDPALRAYFKQFAWYRPHAWEVPLTPVERANVDLIWSYQQTMLAPGPAAPRSWFAPPM